MIYWTAPCRVPLIENESMCSVVKAPKSFMHSQWKCMHSICAHRDRQEGTHWTRWKGNDKGDGDTEEEGGWFINWPNSVMFFLFSWRSCKLFTLTIIITSDETAAELNTKAKLDPLALIFLREEQRQYSQTTHAHTHTRENVIEKNPSECNSSCP